LVSAFPLHSFALSDGLAKSVTTLGTIARMQGRPMT
jgi:hypothetical protein